MASYNPTTLEKHALDHVDQITYDAPPLVEVAMSVQFDPPKGFSVGLLGAFWAAVRDRYPKIRSLDPINAVQETFGGAGSWIPAIQFALASEPSYRLQMSAPPDEQWMIQIQKDRLVVNWRKREGVYPRFHATLDRFREAWIEWQAFLLDLGLSYCSPNLWELVYVNRVARDTLWSTPADWPKVFPGLWGADFVGSEGADLRGFHGQWVWDVKEPWARLYVEPKPGRAVEPPGDELLILSLTARGPLEPRVTHNPDGSKAFGSTPVRNPDGSVTFGGVSLDDQLVAIAKGMDRGHALIVGTFDKITSTAARKAWKRNGN